MTNIDPDNSAFDRESDENFIVDEESEEMDEEEDEYFDEEESEDFGSSYQRF